MTWGDMSPLARVAAVAVVALAIGWTVAGESAMDRIDALLSRDEGGCRGSGDRPSGDLRRAEAATLCLLDRERRKAGLAPFRRDPTLDRASRVHSERMARRDFFAHVDPDGRRPLDRMRAAGWPRVRGGGAENIAWGAGRGSTPAEIVEGWMESPGHRANILDPRNRLIGVGIASGAPEAAGGPDPAVYTTDFA